MGTYVDDLSDAILYKDYNGMTMTKHFDNVTVKDMFDSDAIFQSCNIEKIVCKYVYEYNSLLLSDLSPIKSRHLFALKVS